MTLGFQLYIAGYVLLQILDLIQSDIMFYLRLSQKLVPTKFVSEAKFIPRSAKCLQQNDNIDY